MLEKARREQELREWEESRAERELLVAMEDIVEMHRTGRLAKEYNDMVREKLEAEGVI